MHSRIALENGCKARPVLQQLLRHHEATHSFYNDCTTDCCAKKSVIRSLSMFAVNFLYETSHDTCLYANYENSHFADWKEALHIVQLMIIHYPGTSPVVRYRHRPCKVATCLQGRCALYRNHFNDRCMSGPLQGPTGLTVTLQDLVRQENPPTPAPTATTGR